VSKRKVDPVDYKLLYQEVFGTESGKLVLNDMCNKFGVLKSPSPSSTEAEMRYAEGQRNVALFLLAQVDYDLNELRKIRETYQLEKTSYEHRD